MGGASALVSALNALPWEEDDESDDGEDGDEFRDPAGGTSSAVYERKKRPQRTSVCYFPLDFCSHYFV